jgi:hypothetical protein
VHVKRTGETSIRADGTVLHGNVVPLTDRDKVFVEVTL